MYLQWHSYTWSKATKNYILVLTLSEYKVQRDLRYVATLHWDTRNVATLYGSHILHCYSMLKSNIVRFTIFKIIHFVWALWSRPTSPHGHHYVNTWPPLRHHMASFLSPLYLMKPRVTQIVAVVMDNCYGSVHWCI